MSNRKPTYQELLEENNALMQIVRETIWMAHRYANGRMTYAPEVYNWALKELDRLGLGYLYTGDPADNFNRIARSNCEGDKI